MRKQRNLTESKAINRLAELLPGIRKSGFKETLIKALKTLPASFGKTDALKFVQKEMERPPFTPDATRFRQCFDVGDTGTPSVCIELWEVENFCHVTHEKLQAVRNWLFINFDGLAYPDFELWTTNRFGEGHQRLFSSSEEWYGVKITPLQTNLTQKP